MNLNLDLNREKDKGVSSQSASLSRANEPHCLVISQKFNCETERNRVILDMEQANELREWLNKNLPR